MIPRLTSEARIAALLSTYADRAPTDVDALAMARLAAAGRRGTWWLRVGVAPLELGFILLLLALLTALAGGALLAAGRLLEDDPADVLVQGGFVEPFVGLPPEGAAPSEPATGRLVVQFAARIVSLGYEVHVMWLYEDGRLIWRRNLEGDEAGQIEAFDGQPTLGVIEQRLTPEGAELIRREAIDRLGDWGPAGVVWGSLSARDGTELRPAGFGPGFAMRMADPGSWLAEAYWVDPRLRGYVPSSYLVCVPRLGELPEAARARLPERAASPSSTCPAPASPYVVSLDDARAIAAGLEATGAPRLEDAPILAFGRSWDTSVSFFGILPHGEPVTYGG